MDKPKGGDWAPLSALPATGPEEDAAPAMRISCDGETFELRPERSGGTHYTWLSGPNLGYGFTTSPVMEGTGVAMSLRDDLDVGQHQTNIRNFLSMIDPETGYIEED
jgi:hypothetical protein